ncbi:PIN domain-containing protein, partial [Escherichia coli]|nr:PIN domain-containing protein [Escherichia coli]
MATGKSEKQQVIAFIDYENCSNLTEISLNIYTELIIFAGAKQNNVALPVNAFPEAVKVTLRHVSEVSRNNVDFHLVLELGQCVCRYGPEKEYHIVSADKGYDGIVRT